MVPWSREVTTKIAETPLGEKPAPAIACCILYFLFLLAACYSWLRTKYSWYDVLVISLMLRVVSYGVKAAMLTGDNYRPALGGVYLAFLNAGLGANTAATNFVLITWVSANGMHYYGVEQRYLLKWISIVLIVAVIFFGPITGVIAAGIEYGAYTRYVATYGERCRDAASYGLVSVLFGTICLILRLCITVFLTQRKRSGYRQPSATQPARQPRLIALNLLASCLLGVRACTGAVAIYPERKYVKFWLKDHWFYPMDSLPELLALCFLCWPTLYARMGQAWPPATGGSDAEKQLELQDQDGGHEGSHHAQNGHAQPKGLSAGAAENGDQ